MENKETGVFSMGVVHQILTTNSLEEAKELALLVISEYSKKITAKNENKAKEMVGNAKNTQGLAFSMSNFILAFQGEGVVK